MNRAFAEEINAALAPPARVKAKGKSKKAKEGNDGQRCFHQLLMMKDAVLAVSSFTFCLFTFAFRASGLPSFARLRNGLPVA